MLKDKRILIPIVVFFILVLVAAWNITRLANAVRSSPLQASGTVEAVEVLIAPELGGRVAEVLVAKGDLVKANDPLLKMDDTLLQTQRKKALANFASAKASLVTAEAGLEAAQANLDAAQASAEAAEASSQVELLVAQQALDELNESARVARGNAMMAVASANRAVYDAQYMLDNLSIPNYQVDLETFEAISITKKNMDVAVAAFEPYKYASSDDPTREDLKDDLDEARSDYSAAIRRLEYEAAVDQAEATVKKAMLDLADVQKGADPEDVAIIESRVIAAKAAPKQAEAAVGQAEAGLTQANAVLEQAKAMVNQAQAELDYIDEQIAKLVLYAPSDGVVLSRDIEAGEVIQSGSTLMTIGQLDKLTITVYIPEDRIGQIKLGMHVRVSVDSFPGERFDASVVYIADQAEFAPRNVQTVEGRKTTVFAVELSIANPQTKLKPGMPADVEFRP